MITRPISFILLCGLLLAGGKVPLVGQTAETQTLRPKRWLFIVETSSAMERRKEGTTDVLRNLLRSEMDGQLAAGDSIGVWTFDRELHTGKLPMQKWPVSGKPAVATTIADFVAAQPFANSPTLSSVVQPMLRLVEKSEVLTVLIISSGQGEMSGTPFDKEINEAWATWRKEKSKRPLVTILRGVSGKLAQQQVTAADYAVELPPLPALPEPKPQPVAAKPLATNTPPSPQAAVTHSAPITSAPVAALIFSGPNKKIESGITIEGVQHTNLSVNPVAAASPLVATNPTPALVTQATNPAVIAPMTPPAPAPEPIPPSPSPSPSPKVEEPSKPVAKTTDAEAATSEPVTSATNEQASRPGKTRLLVIAGGALAVILCVAGAALFFLRNRNKQDQPGSIISRSFDDRGPGGRS